MDVSFRSGQPHSFIRRVSTSFSYIAAGVVVIAIGVAIEATR
jgi:hypothetical protein